MGKFIFVLKHNWEWNLSTVLLYHRLSQMCSPQNLKNLRSLLCELVKIAKLSPRYLNELTCQKVFFTIICLVVTVLSKTILVLAKLRVRSSFKLEAISGWKVTSSVSKRTSLCNVRKDISSSLKSIQAKKGGLLLAFCVFFSKQLFVLTERPIFAYC